MNRIGKDSRQQDETFYYIVLIQILGAVSERKHCRKGKGCFNYFSVYFK